MCQLSLRRFHCFPTVHQHFHPAASARSSWCDKLTAIYLCSEGSFIGPTSSLVSVAFPTSYTYTPTHTHTRSHIPNNYRWSDKRCHRFWGGRSRVGVDNTDNDDDPRLGWVTRLMRRGLLFSAFRCRGRTQLPKRRDRSCCWVLGDG